MTRQIRSGILRRCKILSVALIFFLCFSIILTPINSRSTAMAEPVTMSLGSVLVIAACAGAFVEGGMYALDVIFTSRELSGYDLTGHLVSGAAEGMAYVLCCYLPAGLLVEIIGAYTIPGVASYMGDLLGNVFGKFLIVKGKSKNGKNGG